MVKPINEDCHACCDTEKHAVSDVRVRSVVALEDSVVTGAPKAAVIGYRCSQDFPWPKLYSTEFNNNFVSLYTY